MHEDESPGWLKRFYYLPAQRPAFVVLAVLAMAALALSQLFDFKTGQLLLKIDPSMERLLPERDAARRYYDTMNRRFGSDETIVVALAGLDAFTPGMMRRVAALTLELRKIPGVRQVVSLANAPLVHADEDSVEVTSPGAMDLGDAAAVARLRSEIEAHPLYADTLVSDDGQVTALVVYLSKTDGPADMQQALVNAVTQKARAVAPPPPGMQVWVTGAPVIKSATSQALLKQLSVVLPAIAVLMAVLLSFAFRSVRAVLLPILTITLSLICMLGLMAWLERPINLVTAIVPPIIMTTGLPYAIHILSEYYITQEGDAGSPAHIRRLLTIVGLPMLFNGMTTAAGFLALVPNPLAAIREFALLSAGGTMLTVLLTMGFLPSALRLLGGGPLPPPAGEALFNRYAHNLGNIALQHRRWTIAIGILVTLVAAIGTAYVTVGTDYVTNFPKDAEVRTDYEAVNLTLGGANPVSIVLEAPLDDFFTRPDALADVEQLQHWLRQQPEVGKVTTLVDHLKLINQTLNEGDPAYYAVPQGPDADTMIKQLLTFGGGEELEGYIDPEFRRTRLQLRLNVQDSALISGFEARVQARLAELPESMSGRLTGTGVLATRAVESIAAGQWINVALAMGAVYLLLAILFTSWSAGALALLPNALPVLVYFGALGYSGVTLNPTTSLISCIVLGIAVDDTVHYLTRFNYDARRLASERKATYSTLRALVRPMTLTSVTLCLGFLMLTFSELRNQIQFGVLAAFTLAVAWVADMYLTPALAAGARIVTLWDSLRLDLGQAPQRSIPLFEGLSLRQARIFALMSNLLALEQGTRVITEGEQGGDIFVVIDGALDAWVEREDKRVDLSTMRRGHTIGEIGHFSQLRTANVDTKTAVRMLKFNDADLERMVKRYPRIAAVVLRNLNRIQAARIANNMQKLHGL
ncbi:MAG: MMPL family transporter [Nevskiales bacterium]